MRDLKAIVGQQPIDVPLRPQRKGMVGMVFWALLGLAVIPSLACVPLFSQWVRKTVELDSLEDGRLLARCLATDLGDKVKPGVPLTADQFPAFLRAEPHMDFVCVTDAAGAIRYLTVNDAETWAHCHTRYAGPDGRSVLSLAAAPTATWIDRGHGVYWAPIMGPSAPAAAPGTKNPGAAAGDAMCGAVLIGVKDPIVGSILPAFQVIQIAISLGAALIMAPLIHVFRRRWLKNLRNLVEAAQRLSDGLPPRPVKVVTLNELGYLSATFNQMAGRLVASRRALLDANAALEQTVHDRTQRLEQANKALLAQEDPLTGLANRRHFNERLEEQYAISDRARTDLACIMIDLDGFKAVNDQLGHKQGDELLVLVGRVLRECCRESDLPARLGGDEFAVILPGVRQAEAHDIAQRIGQRFAGAAREFLATQTPAPPTVTLSIGLASLRHAKPRDADDLICKGDTALYAAKRSGRARVVVYDERIAA
jgi:diguanylate cyclase (GGDEF)-like protein